MSFLRKEICLLSALMVFCIPASATSIPQSTLQEIFETHSGVVVNNVTVATFPEFKFDIGTTKDAKIIRSIRGGMSIVKWGEDEKSFLAINAFAKLLNDNFTQEMDVPLDIIKGITSANSTAALDYSSLRNSWKIGTLDNIGQYCVGYLRGGFAGNITSTGYFLDEEFGFCLQISTLKGSGIELEQIERIGRALITEMKNRAKAEGIIPNPLSKALLPVAESLKAPVSASPGPASTLKVAVSPTVQKDQNSNRPGKNSSLIVTVAMGVLVLLFGILRLVKKKR